MDKVRLSSGHLMPVVGLGTWQAASDTITRAVLFALNIGYRHFDTAYNYKNEEAIGYALEKWCEAEGNTRENLFVTTKLPHVANRPSDVEKYLSKSLKLLRLNYVDLYLVHMPFTFVADETGDAPAKNEDGYVELDKTDHIAVWREMEKQVKAGKVRSIGVSNFNRKQLERLCKEATIQPSCLQIELHAALQQKELRDFCKEKNIIVTAYSPLGSPGSRQHFQDKYKLSVVPPDLLNNEVVKELANKYERTPAQILLRHLIQLGVVIIPKSTNSTRIAENAEVFDFKLSDDDMNKMSTLDQGSEGRILNFLFFKGVENHPEYPFTQEIKNKKSSELSS